MAVKTEPVRAGDWLKWEQDDAALRYSRDLMTVLSGQNLASGTVVGKVKVGTVTAAAAAGNTGDGTIGTLSAGTGAKDGVYKVTFIEPGTDLGTFEVEDPDGVVVGTGVVGTAFAGEVNFTITDGAADFVAGDQFDVTVAAGTGKVKASPDTASDGSEVAVGILLNAVDASAEDTKGVIIARDAIVSRAALTYDATVNDAAKRAAKKTQLEALGIEVRAAA